MATRFSVSEIKTDEDTFSRKTSVRVGTSGDVKFQTPMKVGLDSVTELPLYEAYKRIKPETINNCIGSEDKCRIQGRDLEKRCKGRFNALILEYDSKDMVPSDRMVEALSDLQYPHTDIIITPSWFDLITGKNGVNVERYLNLSKVFVEAASVRNSKPILGSIPQSIPPGKLDEVIKFYIDRDITSFVVDSHGRTFISTSWIRTFQRNLEEYDIEKECVLYSINAFQGIIRKTKSSTEAKDFIGFTAGFDVMGGKHIAKFSRKDEGNNGYVFGRRFNRNTYNYEKQECTEEEKRRIDAESIRSQNEEFSVIRNIISDGSLKPLLTSKSLTQETTNTIFSFRSIGKKRLDKFI
jgi:hypothetical protein